MWLLLKEKYLHVDGGYYFAYGEVYVVRSFHLLRFWLLGRQFFLLYRILFFLLPNKKDEIEDERRSSFPFMPGCL
jgi:hypothetical protein